MHAKGKPLLALVLLLLALLPTAARAQITVSFYSHELGSSFPHAFIVVQGAPQAGGPPVDANYGFTAKSVTPALLMGSVAGVVESAKPSYIESSDRKFSLRISDAQYAGLMGVVTKWKTLPGKSYNLNTRNCIHFVGEAAQALGLKVIFDKKLLKKPRSFLEFVMKLNPSIGGG
jgi:hypothetical protein